MSEQIVIMAKETFRQVQQEQFPIVRRDPRCPLPSPSYMGMKVRVVDNELAKTQRIKVSADVPMTEEGRASMNSWLASMFGHKYNTFIVDTAFLELTGLSPVKLMAKMV